MRPHLASVFACGIIAAALAACPRPPQNRPIRIAVVALNDLQVKAEVKFNTYCSEPVADQDGGYAKYVYPDGGSAVLCDNLAKCIDDLSAAAQSCGPGPSDMGVSCGDKARNSCKEAGVL